MHPLRPYCATLLLAACEILLQPALADEVTRPNILWVTCEDTGPQLGCYGDTYAKTPNLDRLAAEGLRYERAWSNAPVCAPARTTIISGVYPTSLGAEHMRSEVAPPAFLRMYPQLLREQGYYCTNNAKEDYNLTKPGEVWDDSSAEAHWKNRKPGQPFFAIFNIGASHEGGIRRRPHTLKHDPAAAPVPAYHPDTPEVRHDWAQYYDNVTQMDGIAGQRLAELEAAGLAQDTIVFFYGDHGSGMPRSKRWPYNSGLQVPLIVRVPEKFKYLAPREYAVGGASDRLVAFVDLAPTLLSLIGVKAPAWMQGHAFMGRYDAPRQPYLFGFRGRMDERYDLVRTVRNERYVYIRNYMPQFIYGQYIDYMFQTPTTQIWKRLYDEHKLAPPRTYFWEPKPAEELYDLEQDPDEVRNLAGSPEYRKVLDELRQAHRRHVLAIRDYGFLSEAEQHSRASGSTMYEVAQDPAKYALENILSMADLASSRRADVLAQLRQGLKDSDSGVRYWAVMGLWVQGPRAIEAAHADLLAALRDPSPSVRVTAARVLGHYGSPSDLEQALRVLGELAPANTNGAYISLMAVGAIDALGAKAAPLHALLKTMPRADPKSASRARAYGGHVVEAILGEPPKLKAKAAKPAM